MTSKAEAENTRTEYGPSHSCEGSTGLTPGVRIMTPIRARQGVVSGRVVTVLGSVTLEVGDGACFVLTAASHLKGIDQDLPRPLRRRRSSVVGGHDGGSSARAARAPAATHAKPPARPGRERIERPASETPLATTSTCRSACRAAPAACPTTRRLLSCPGELAIPSAQPQEINSSRRLRSACVAPHRYRPW